MIRVWMSVLASLRALVGTVLQEHSRPSPCPPGHDPRVPAHVCSRTHSTVSVDADKGLCGNPASCARERCADCSYPLSCCAPCCLATVTLLQDNGEGRAKTAQADGDASIYVMPKSGPFAPETVQRYRKTNTFRPGLGPATRTRHRPLSPIGTLPDQSRRSVAVCHAGAGFRSLHGLDGGAPGLPEQPSSGRRGGRLRDLLQCGALRGFLDFLAERHQPSGRQWRGLLHDLPSGPRGWRDGLGACDRWQEQRTRPIRH